MFALMQQMGDMSMYATAATVPCPQPVALAPLPYNALWCDDVAGGLAGKWSG